MEQLYIIQFKKIFASYIVRQILLIEYKFEQKVGST